MECMRSMRQWEGLSRSFLNSGIDGKGMFDQTQDSGMPTSQ